MITLKAICSAADDEIPTCHDGVLQCSSSATGDLLLQSRLGEGDGGSTVLELLAVRFPYYTLGRWRELIDQGQVNVNGQSVAHGQITEVGDLLEYRAVGFTEPEVPTCFEPVMKTADLLLVGKPAGTPVTRTGLIVRNTLVNLLRHHYGEEIHPLHRLDRETGGLILCARNHEACRRWQNPRHTPITGKYYLVVVRGRMPLGTRYSEQPLAIRADSPVRCRMWPEADGKPCRTIFHTLAVESAFSLVLAELVTGRRHQIRAHLAHLGYPVVGDKIYSHDGYYFLKRLTGELTADDFRELGANNHTLHAWALRLKLPGESERLFFSRMFSEDLCRYLKLFPDWEKGARERLTQICLKATNR